MSDQVKQNMFNLPQYVLKKVNGQITKHNVFEQPHSNLQLKKEWTNPKFGISFKQDQYSVHHLELLNK